ncbi:MAG: pilin [Pseudomonadales bacterium]|nr:pilin [Pseudomonadales bacterium]
MNVRRLLAFLGTVLLSSTLTVTLATAKTTNIVADTEISQITKNPWLREKLPKNTLLYARIPSIWSAISYKDDSFKFALGNKNFTQTINLIQEASSEWIAKADAGIKPFLALLAGQLNGPIEIAVVANGAMPGLMITASLNYTDTRQLQLLIDSLIKSKLIKAEIEKMQQGSGLLLTDLGATPYRWDNEKKRLNILVALGGAKLSALDSAFNALTANIDSPMLANELQMDSSKQGLYLWFNNEAAFPIYQGMTPEPIMRQMQIYGVPQMKSLALSWGVRDNKGRIKLQLEAENSGLIRRMLPVNNNKLNIMTAGEPNLTALLALPSVENYNSIEQVLMQVASNSSSYKQFKAAMFDQLGFTVEDILAAVGPEMVGISDQSGEYFALRIRDSEGIAAIIDQLVQLPGVLKKQHKINGRETTYLKLPSMFNDLNTADMPELPYFITDMLTKVSTHLYWQIEGDYLIMADLPQVLQDRQMLLTEQTLEQWLNNTQHQNLKHSTLAISGSIDNAPRRLYYAYLNALQALADVTGAQIDTFSLPSAQQLSLSKQGTLGLQIDSAEQHMAIELTFESTPADILLSGQGMTTVAGIGILAAVALPAYQDYMLRANTTRALFEASELKQQIAEFHFNEDRYPNNQELQQMDLAPYHSDDYSIDLQADSGVILILFPAAGFSRVQRIQLTPTSSAQQLSWDCRSDLALSIRPQMCRKDLN